MRVAQAEGKVRSLTSGRSAMSKVVLDEMTLAAMQD